MIYDIGSHKHDDVSFGNRAELVEQRLPRRIRPIHFGIKEHESPLQFKLIFGSDRALDRYDLEDIAFWLTGHQDYQWLTICQPDMALSYRCLIRNLQPISVAWAHVAFEADVICDCPYAYGQHFTVTQTITDNADLTVRNDSTIRDYLRPTLKFTPSGNSGTVTWKIVNHSDGDRVFQITGIPAVGSVVTVDNETGIITEQTNHVNLYGGFNMNLFRLVPGDNHLTVYGSGVTEISGQTLHNVSA